MSHVFKIGDRAKIAFTCEYWAMWLGKEVTILGPALVAGKVYVHIDGVGDTYKKRRICILPENLTPILPPKSQVSEILAMQDLPDYHIARVGEVA